MDAKHLRLPSPRGADTCQPGSFTLFNPRRRPAWLGLLRRPSLAPTLPPVALLLKMFLVVQDIGFQVFKFCFTFHFFSFLKKYLFLERGKGGRETSICGCLSHAPGDLAGNPGMCPGWNRTRLLSVGRTIWSPLSHTCRGRISFFTLMIIVL